MGGLGVAFALLLVYGSKKFHVEEDPLVEALNAVLPGTNCGACGYAGCAALAELLAKGDAPINACPAGGQEVADLIAKALGKESLKAKRILAVVLCRGGNAEAVKNAVYRGDMSCSAANITGGEKLCSYSCLGYADCVRACAYDAIDMSSNGLPVVFYDKCIGCGACAKACPRNIIEMHDELHKLFVYCKNKDKGPQAKKACKVSCIACTLCVKDAGAEGAIAMKDNLAVINYDSCPQNDASTKRCPTKCILYGEEELSTKSAFYSKQENKSAV